jgi:hypothetical protein
MKGRVDSLFHHVVIPFRNLLRLPPPNDAKCDSPELDHAEDAERRGKVHGEEQRESKSDLGFKRLI